MAQEQSSMQPSQGITVTDRHGQPSLVTRLGLKQVSDHIDALGLLYLIGCAYQDGARSLRQIAEMLRVPTAGLLAEDLARKMGQALPTSLRAIHAAVRTLEALVGKELVNRTGEGLGFDGLTDEGKRLWAQTADFAREFWA
jgi:hypothetical protein